MEELRERVKVLLKSQQHEIIRLNAKIDDLKEEIKRWKDYYYEETEKNEELMKWLAIAQATWAWEAHLARFVVDSSQIIKKFDRYKQMSRHLKKNKPKDNLWKRITSTIGRWTKDHWYMVNTVRRERNGIAHPHFIDLDLVEAQLTEEYSDFNEEVEDMLDILKMTAGLMKFGRLARFYEDNKKNKNFPCLRLSSAEKDVLNVIISWDRNFEQIGGLQHVEHEVAKKYVKKYVNDPKMINHYFRVIDFIKEENGKMLGKLASELQKSDHFTRRMTAKERKVVNKLKSLVPKDSRYVVNLECSKFATIAKLHIPDFLPKELWKHGTRLVKKYF